jgi:hypothetical protein
MDKAAAAGELTRQITQALRSSGKATPPFILLHGRTAHLIAAPDANPEEVQSLKQVAEASFGVRVRRCHAKGHPDCA